MFMKHIQRCLLTPKLLTILCLAFLLALSACNSSEPDDPTPTPQLPDDQNSEDEPTDSTDQNQSDDDDNQDAEEPEPVDNEDDTVEEPTDGSGGVVQDKGRIQFDAGATAATLTGELAKSSGDSYILNAAAGQIMTLSLDGPEDSSFGITNADGLIFEPTGPITFHTTELPTTGDYMVTVASGSGGPYELTITIDNKGSDGSAEDDQGQAQEDTIEKEEEGHSGNTSLPDGPRINTTLNPLGDVVLVFKGLSQDGNFVQVENIDIYKAGELSLLQTIPFRSETEVPVQPPALVIEDVNFDGNTDLGIPLFTTAGSNLPLAYFLWDPTVNQFVRNANFDVLMAPTILEGKRILTTSRAGAGDIYYTLYAIGKGGPRAIAAQNCEVTQNENGEAIIRNQAFSIDEFDNPTLTFESITTEEGCLEFKDPR